MSDITDAVTSNGSRSFGWNFAGQIQTSGSNTYVYDGYNRRVKQTDASGTSYSFYTQGGQLIHRYTAKGDENYIYLGGNLIAKDGTFDSNRAKQHFTPFGRSIEGAPDDVNYTGHKFDKDLGLIYAQARYYDPVIGRFYSPDPIGSKDQFNLYAYVGNDPMNKTDPTGTTCVMNDGKAVCKVDEPGNLNGKELTAANQAYSNAVNKLLSRDTNLVLSVNGKTFTVNSGSLAKSLMGTKVIVGQANRARTAGGPLHPDSKSGGPEITISKSAVTHDRAGLGDLGTKSGEERVQDDLSKTFIHESFHLDKGESIMIGMKNFNVAHQNSYDKVSSDFFGENQ